MKYEIKKFKDGQVSALVNEIADLTIRIRGNSYEDLFAAASVKEAWNAVDSKNKLNYSTLEIMCLIGQRSDRRFNKGESFDLKIIADFINSMEFDTVRILHPHSEISLALINNSEKIDHSEFVQKTFDELNKPILVSPDAGAYKISHSIAEKLGANLVPSNKVRVNGEPQISIQGNVQGKNCLIIDDMADGGRTFSNLAKELKSQGAEKVYLYVTHGQFNYGFEELKESIDGIYCTNSFKDFENIERGYLKQYKVI